MPLQVQICNLVPSAVCEFGTSRQRPEFGLRSDPFGCGTQTCALVRLQVHSCTFTPSVIPLRTTSRHFPSADRLRSERTVHRCAADPLHVYSCTAVPSAVELFATSTHFDASPTTGPEAPGVTVTSYEGGASAGAEPHDVGDVPNVKANDPPEATNDSDSQGLDDAAPFTVNACTYRAESDAPGAVREIVAPSHAGS